MRKIIIVGGVIVVFVLSSWRVGLAASEPDELMPGKIVVVKAARLAKFVAKPQTGTTFDLPDLPANDPSVQGGTLTLYDTFSAGAGVETHSLAPGAQWKGLGSPPGSKGWKYRGAGTVTDPCRVTIKGGVVSAICKGTGVSLTPPVVRRLEIILTIGTSSKQYIATFGGVQTLNETGILKMKGAPPGAYIAASSAPCGTAVARLGGVGDGPAQFYQPAAIAVDASGNVFVADTGNDRIKKLDSTGQLLATWGSYGSGDGEFFEPFAVALDASGNVYVADTSNQRIQKFDNGGTFLAKWGSAGSGNGEFSNPLAIAVDGSGNVFVSDSSNFRIQKFDSSQNFVTSWGSLGSADGQFNAPRGIAIDSSGNVFVADTSNARIQIFDNGGTFVNKWDLSSYGAGGPVQLAMDSVADVYVGFQVEVVVKLDGSGALLLQFPTGSNSNGPIALGVSGTSPVYTVDPGYSRVQKFDANANFVAVWGGVQDGDGYFQGAIDVAVGADGTIYVSDLLQNRIQKFDSNRVFVTKWGSAGAGDGQFDGPAGIGLDANGNVYVADIHNHRIQKFDANGTFITKWGTPGTASGQFQNPTGVAIGVGGDVYVADRGNSRVQQFTSTGNFVTSWGMSGSGAGEFGAPSHVAVDWQGNVYVTDEGANARVQKFAADGSFILSWGSLGTGIGQFLETRGIAVDDRGDVWVGDRVNATVQVFHADGAFSAAPPLARLGERWGIAADHDGNILVADEEGVGIFSCP